MKYGKRYAYVLLIPIVVHLFLIPSSRYKKQGNTIRSCFIFIP
jgi:hypothetical protein